MKLPPNLYLDSDGVLLDFDKVANDIFGMDSRLYEKTYGSDAFWKKLEEAEEFFFSLPLMPDAIELYEGVKHLNPIILTGSPSQLGERARVDKFRAAEKHFGKQQRIIICQSKLKSMYCQPGDTIVDDWPKHRAKWEEKGGLWVHHVNASQSLTDLKNLGWDV